MVRAAFSLAVLCAITGQFLFDCFGYPRVTRDISGTSASGHINGIEGFAREPQIDPV